MATSDLQQIPLKALSDTFRVRKITESSTFYNRLIGLVIFWWRVTWNYAYSPFNRVTCLINNGKLLTFIWSRMNEISFFFSGKIEYFQLWIICKSDSRISGNCRLKTSASELLLRYKLKGYHCELNMQLFKLRVHWNYGYCPFDEFSIKIKLILF